jgi:transposase-like protein
MARRKRRKFTPQFKADAVRLVTTGAKTIAEVTEGAHSLTFRTATLGATTSRSWLLSS